MSISKFGTRSLLRQPGARLSENPSGLIVYDETLSGFEPEAVQLYDQLKRGETNSTRFAGLQLEEKALVFAEGDQASLILRWVGTATSSGSSSEPLPDPFWSVSRTPSQDPIDSNMQFKTVIGGTPNAPLNGAIFDDEGLFVGFPATLPNGDENDYAGLTKYLENALVLRKQWVSRFEPNGSEVVPRIDTPVISASRGIGRLPAQLGRRNYLKTDLAYTRRGPVFEINEEWTLSGPRGWLPFYKY